MRNLSPVNADDLSKDEPMSIMMSPTRVEKTPGLAKEAKLHQQPHAVMTKRPRESLSKESKE